MRKLYLPIFTVVLMSMVWAAPVRASYLGDNSHVQLSHILAMVKPRPGKLLPEQRPLTPILTVPKADDVAFVCQRAPRVAEAILAYFSKNPAPMTDRRRVDMDKMVEQVHDIARYVNSALGKNAVSEVYVVEGGKSLGRGVMARLPFAQTQGCGRVLEEYERRMQELLGDK